MKCQWSFKLFSGFQYLSLQLWWRGDRRILECGYFDWQQRQCTEIMLYHFTHPLFRMLLELRCGCFLTILLNLLLEFLGGLKDHVILKFSGVRLCRVMGIYMHVSCGPQCPFYLERSIIFYNDSLTPCLLHNYSIYQFSWTTNKLAYIRRL